MDELPGQLIIELLLRIGADQSAIVGDVVLDAVSLDRRHGSHPFPIGSPSAGPSAERLGDVGRWVGDTACDGLLDSAAAGAPVTVSGRRAEGLGALGRQEGIAALAVAVLIEASA